MNKDDALGLIIFVIFFSMIATIIAILISLGEESEPKKPTKERLTETIIEDTLIRYHPEIYKVCDEFEESIDDNEDFEGERIYQFKPYKTVLEREYGVTHDGDYAYIHMTCEVTATYQWNAFTHVQENYEYSTPKYTFYKKYNGLDLTFLELVE